MLPPAGIIAVLLAAGAVLGEEAGNQRIVGPTVDIAGQGGDIAAAGAIVTIKGEARTLNAAGATVTITANVAGNLNVGAADVAIDSTVGGDIWATGASVNLRGHVAKNVWLAAGNIVSAATVGGDLKAAGGRVTIDPASETGGSLYAAGGDVTVAGHAGGSVGLGGSRVLFDGRADHDVTVRAEELTIGPDAVIAGNLVLVGDTQATIAPGAKISGQTRHVPAKEWWKGPRVDPRPGQFGFALFLAGTAILAGLGLMVLGRASFDEAASSVRRRPGSRLLVGLITLIFIPGAAIVLAMTVIGIPLAVGLILLIPLLLIIGHATAALGVADWVLNRAEAPRSFGRSFGLLAAGAVGISLIGLIPFVGPLIVFVTLLLGAGAFLATLRGRLKARGDTTVGG